MANRDELTGKGSMFGGHRKHRRGSSGGGGAWSFRAQRSLKKWKPNLRKVNLIELATGKITNLKISMKTYKKLRQGETISGHKLPI